MSMEVSLGRPVTHVIKVLYSRTTVSTEKRFYCPKRFARKTSKRQTTLSERARCPSKCSSGRKLASRWRMRCPDSSILHNPKNVFRGTCSSPNTSMCATAIFQCHSSLNGQTTHSVLTPRCDAKRGKTCSRQASLWSLTVRSWIRSQSDTDCVMPCAPCVSSLSLARAPGWCRDDRGARPAAPRLPRFSQLPYKPWAMWPCVPLALLSAILSTNSASQLPFVRDESVGAGIFFRALCVLLTIHTLSACSEFRASPALR